MILKVLLPARRPRRSGRRRVGIALIAGLLLVAASAAQGQYWFSAKPMPEFENRSTAAWINSKPLGKADLAGKVVLIEVWTSV